MIAIASLFTSLKTKIYAAISLLFIALLAIIKWKSATNTHKDEKIKKLKKEVEIAKKVGANEKELADFYGYQNALDIQSDEAAKRTEELKHENVGNNNSHDFESVRL